MTPDRARELLGGLASGILTDEERQTLFEAALHDQTLFNEVADELEFAAFLQSPDTRAQLANKIEVEPERRSWFAAKSRWLALTGALAAASVVFVAVWNRTGHPLPQETRQEVAVAAPERSQPVTTNITPAGQPEAGVKLTTAPLADARRAEPKPKQPPVAVQPNAMARSDTAAPKQELAANAPPPPSPSKTVAVPAPEAPAPGRQASGGDGSKAIVPAPDTMMLRAANSAGLPVLLTGTVHDAAGVPISNAIIEIRDTATNSTIKTNADSAGRFAAPSVRPGVLYTLTAEASGFRKEQRSGITVAANQPVALDIPLQVGGMAESVSVTAASGYLPVAQAQQAAPGQQVAVLDFLNSTPDSQSGQQIADLVSNQLLDRGNVRIIDREKVKQAVEQQAKMQRPPNAKDAAAVGRALGADAVITGSVKPDRDKSADHVAISAEVIDTKRGRAMARVAAKGPSLQGAANSVGLLLDSRLAAPLAGEVTRVEGALVSVSISPPAAPRIGVQLDVYRGQRKIGELTLTSAFGQLAVGKYTGSTPVRAGDRIASAR